MSSIKSKFFTCLIILIIIFPTTFSKMTICNYSETIYLINEKYELNNMIYLYESYYDLLLEDSLIYLIGYQGIEIFDIGDINKITKIKEILGEPILDFINLEGMFREIDLNNNLIYTYGLTSDYLYGEIYNYNDTHITNSNYFQYNISIGDNLRSYNFFMKNESTLYAITENKLIDKDSSNSWLNIAFLTFDLTNKTKPEILNQSSIYYDEDYITWIDNQQVVFDWTSFHLENNLLFLVRIYRDYNSGDYTFNKGFIKIWAISDFSNPIELATIAVDKGGYSFVSIYKDLLFYNTNNYSFDLYNISDVNNIKKINTYITDINPKQFIFEDNTLYLLYSSKFEILDITNPFNIKKLSQYIPRFQGDGYFNKGISQNNVLYLIRTSEFPNRNFFVFDCNNLNNPKRIIPTGIKLGSTQKSTLIMSLVYTGFIVGIITVITPIIIITIKRKRKIRNNF